jgi:hypothetical protein
MTCLLNVVFSVGFSQYIAFSVQSMLHNVKLASRVCPPARPFSWRRASRFSRDDATRHVTNPSNKQPVCIRPSLVGIGRGHLKDSQDSLDD